MPRQMLTGRRRLLTSAAALTLAPVLLGACSGSAGPERGTTVADVNDPIANDIKAGETVTVSGNVSSVISPSAFRLSGGDLGTEALLVVGARDAMPVQEGEVVQVTGEVKIFNFADFRTDLGFDFGPEPAFTGFAGDTAIVATRVETTLSPSAGG